MGATLSVRQQFPGAGLPYLVELDVRVEDGKPVCQALRAQRRARGEPVTSEGLRKLPVAGFLRNSVPVAAMKAQELSPGHFKLEWLDEPGDEGTATKLDQRIKRRWPPSREQLTQVARLYREARPSGAPRRHIENELRVSPSTAARLIRAAKDQGLLK